MKRSINSLLGYTIKGTDGNGLQLLQYLRKHEKEDCVVMTLARNSKR